MEKCEEEGVTITTKVDPTDPEQLKNLLNLLPKTEKDCKGFDTIVLLYPQVVENIRNVSEPLNSEYIYKIFKAINESNLLKSSGMLQVCLNSWELTDWDL